MLNSSEMLLAFDDPFQRYKEHKSADDVCISRVHERRGLGVGKQASWTKIQDLIRLRPLMEEYFVFISVFSTFFIY